MSEQASLFTRLTKLFRSGPIVKRRVRNVSSKTPAASTALEVFRRAHSDVYNSTLSAYGAFDRTYTQKRPSRQTSKEESSTYILRIEKYRKYLKIFFMIS